MLRYAGGIVSIILFLLMAIPAVFICYRKYQERKSPTTAMRMHAAAQHAVQLNEIRTPDSEAVPDASYPQYHAISKPHHTAGAAVPNSEGC
jgi:hypothetical protein